MYSIKIRYGISDCRNAFFLHKRNQKIKLKRKPTIIIPSPTILTKVSINGSFNTLRRIIISGNDKAITDIINANEVPKAAPFSINTETMGTIPAALA